MDIYSPAATRSHFSEIASHYMAHYNITIIRLINSSSHHHRAAVPPPPSRKTLVMPLRLNWHVAMTDTNFVNQSVFTFMLAIVLTLSYIIQYWMNSGYNVTNKCKLWLKCSLQDRHINMKRQWLPLVFNGTDIISRLSEYLY